MNPFLATDGYKTAHHLMYPKGTKRVYSNFTPRSAKHGPVGTTKVVLFGVQMVTRQIHDMFYENFFSKDKEKVIKEIEREYSMYLGTYYNADHISRLWDLQRLPINIKTLPEGSRVNIGVPVLTITNTLDDFYWLPNFLETLISTLLWKPITSATIADAHKQSLLKWATKTDKENLGFVDYQAHDFSMRGLDSIDAAISSGLGHATSFLGSDSLPVIHGARKYYHQGGAVVHSINATEHSVMCAGGKEDEIETFRHLMRTFPTGGLSIVSDTWDLWKVLDTTLVELREEILARDGKIVIRPDSGDPADILCGIEVKDVDSDSEAAFEDYCQEFLEVIIKEETAHGEQGSPESGYFRWQGKVYYVTYDPDWNRYDKQFYFIDNLGDNLTKVEVELTTAQKGVIQSLWETFGGAVNDQGYKVLDSHIGAIYGDSINLARQEDICSRLAAKGFASTNVVFGIGSFTYQYNTRDTFGFAMKATHVTIQNESGELEHRSIFKDPITDDGTKKSAKGLLKVVKDPEVGYKVIDQVSFEEEMEGELRPIYINGLFYSHLNLEAIRKRIKENK